MDRRRNLLAASMPIGGLDDLITFYINTVEAHAEEGMTFYDWILSDYFDVTNPYGIRGQNPDADVREFVREYGLVYPKIITASGLRFEPQILTTDTIIDGQSYIPYTGGFPI